MDAQEVLATVRAGTAPSTWTVLPLRRDTVRQSALRWALLAVVDIAIFVAVLLITVPYNYTHGLSGAIVTTFLLGVLAFVAFGGAGIALFDLRRVARADAYWLVITPNEFVLAEPGRLVHVPLGHIAFITLRGVKGTGVGVDTNAVADPIAYEAMRTGALNRTPVARILGMGGQRRPRQPASLAFLDTRTDTEVLVARDESYGDLLSIERLLQIASDATERSRRR